MALDTAGYNILLVYRAAEFPLRHSALDHLECFRRHSNARIFYCNLAAGGIPPWLLDVPWDLVVLHTIGLDRGSRPAFREMLDLAAPLAKVEAAKIALPQDEFTSTDLLVELINRLGVQRVYSVAPQSEWPKIYEGTAPSVRFNHVLTGYIEPATLQRIERMDRSRKEGGGQRRPLDVGYRGYDVPAWFGSFGVIKGQLPGAVQRSGETAGLRCDISTRYEDTIYGDDWYRFLLDCRWTFGIEGGASLLDRDGSLRAATDRFVTEHPGATFEEIVKHCFASQDGNLNLTAISPRHLEAGMTGTAQLLVEGHYDGILRPGVHYLPLRRDLADLDEKVAQLADESSRMKLVRAMHEDVVRNPAYGYPRFVERLLQDCLPARPVCGGSTGSSAARLDRLCRRAGRRDARWRWRFGALRAASRRMPRILRGSWVTATLRWWLYPLKNR